MLVTEATGRAERQAAVDLLSRLRGTGRITLGETRTTTPESSWLNAGRSKSRPTWSRIPKARASAIDGRTTRHPGYAISQRVKKGVEEIFGWTKTMGGGRKLRYIGVARNQMWANLTVAAYNLVRMAKLALNPG